MHIWDVSAATRMEFLDPEINPERYNFEMGVAWLASLMARRRKSSTLVRAAERFTAALNRLADAFRQ